MTATWVAISFPLLLAAPPSPSPAPFEKTPQNVKVLPRDWTRRQIIDEVMKKWTADLGVRCQHCHVGKEGAPWSEWDFPSDAKPTKQRAREMLQMLDEINRRLAAMPGLPDAGATPLRATCFTCHRGLPRPRRIEEVFEQTRVAKGLDAAIAEYKELRAKYLAPGGYDFSVRPLLRQARGRLEAKDAASAEKLLNLALELGFDSLATRSTLADVALAKGDRAGAVAQLEKAMAFAQNAAEKEFVREQMQQARGAESPPPP